MKKSDFIDLVSKKAGLTKKDTAGVVDAVIESITESLAKGNGVNFIGFGSFSVVDKAAREGKVPGSNKTYKTPATKAVKFKVGKGLKETVSSVCVKKCGNKK
ncbi:HU family DNA-binding protein [Campylobacter hyointestinalis]|uniref:DNA-binding protein HU 1 (DNA-binding protein II) (HB) n=1 Tax=Campylobacter hyointestinalis subsp. hyointestinalis TaxID=91352 RepID=A0A2S5J3Z1_CAMHY|nr:HU family DNA-binding protein [Campylobacter hyointestinalis]ANE32509.1 DNA-binding protein HU [Campylobacter hyointestinalis subsp. hyointestinalis LMG 9260]KEA45145.1 DNA-binding protein [Campylobacter hyointestinalis subsp. hyointestinalis]MBT0611540.1 HU family DNA-binding protein [Campylobacter hyointestinalis subsp. hyointestinalis]MDY2999083.1 HU family DNA-binding protein [Campylobacter hyointestinalis]PPB52065.1 HU family DNA-binding protein [Campylobacter hyointestinalis subsp. hy